MRYYSNDLLVQGYWHGIQVNMTGADRQCHVYQNGVLLPSHTTGARYDNVWYIVYGMWYVVYGI